MKLAKVMASVYQIMLIYLIYEDRLDDLQVLIAAGISIVILFLWEIVDKLGKNNGSKNN